MNTEDTAIPFRLSPLAEGDAPKRVVPHPTGEYLTRQALLTDPAKVGDEESRAAARRLAKEALTAQAIAEMPEESFRSDEEKTAAASKIVELMTGEKDYDGRLWNGGTGFKTGADYLRSVKETVTRGMVAAADPDLQAWMRMSDGEKDAKVDSERGVLSYYGEATGDVSAFVGELVRGVPRLSDDEYAAAPKDVREASDRMGSVMWDTFEDKERAECEAKVRDWRGGEWQRLKRRSEYEAKLRRKNALLYLPDMIRSLQSDEAKELAGELAQRPSEIPNNWTARLGKLPTRDIETLAQIRGMTREQTEGGFFNWLGDMGIAAYNGAHGLFSGLGAQGAKYYAAKLMGWNGERVNEMIRRKHALWSAYAGWSSPVSQISDRHGAVANFTIGLASAVPFIASMHLKSLGYAACAAEMMSAADAQAAAAGIDTTDLTYCARNALAGGLYAYMLKAVSPKFLGASATGAAEEMALRTAFMKGVMSGITKLDTLKVMSQRTASGALMMAMQQGIAAVNEDLNLGGDAWRDAGQRFTETFVSSIPDMLAFSAHGVLKGHARASGGWRKAFGAEGRANRSQNLREAVENAFAVRTAVDGDMVVEERMQVIRLQQLQHMEDVYASRGRKGLLELGLKPEVADEAVDLFEQQRREYGAAKALELEWKHLDGQLDGEALEELDADTLNRRNEAKRRYDQMMRELDVRRDHLFETMKDVPGTLRDLASVRNVWAQGRAVGAGTADGTDAGAAALVKAGFTAEDAAILSREFGAERRNMYSPAATEALREMYTRSTRGMVEAHAALASAFKGKVRTEDGRVLIDLPMPDGGTGTLAVETVDLSRQFYGEAGSAPEMARQVERETKGKVKADDWIRMTDAERRRIVRKYRLHDEGYFMLTDPADPSLHVDSGAADAVMGVIRLDPTADPDAGFHEAMHGFLRFCQETGFFDEADLKWLTEKYGAGTSKNSVRVKGEDGRVHLEARTEQLDEESAAEGFRQYLAKRMAGSFVEEPGPFRKLFGLIGRLRHLHDSRAATERLAANAEEALYDAFLAGKYQHIRDLTFAAPAAPKAEAGAGTEAPQTGAPPPKPAEPAGGTPAPAPAPAPSPAPAPAPAPAPRVVSFEALTPTGGKKVKGHYEIVPLASLLHSNKAGYPMDLQQRDRKGNKGEEQTREEHIANFEPGYLLADPKTDSGAMVVARRPGPDGKPQLVVVSGNGRTMVLEEMARRNLYDKYRNRMKEWAKENGVENAVADADNPVLVRVVDELGGATLKELADLSNTNAIQQMNEEETARADADLVRSLDLAKLYRPNMDGSANMAAGASDGFFREFVRATGDTSLLNSDGTFTEALRMRARRALLAIACGQGERGRDVVKKLVEGTDALGIDRQKDTAAAIAPHVAAVEARPEYAIGPDVSRAFADYIEYRENRDTGKKWGTLGEYLKQGDMLDPRSEVAESVMRLLDDPKGAPVLAETVRLYAEAAKGETDGLLGAARTRAEIWRDAAKAVDEKAAQERARDEAAFKPETRFSIRAEKDAEKKDDGKKKTTAQGPLSESDQTPPVQFSGGATSIPLTRERADPVTKFGDNISQDGVKSPVDFLTGLVHALGSAETNPDKTQYFDITHEDGKNLSLRVANHRASSGQYREHGNTADVKTSIVVKTSDKPFKADRDVELTEHVYFSDRLTAEREAGIARAVAEWIATGEWNGPAADQVNMSPRKRSIAGVRGASTLGVKAEGGGKFLYDVSNLKRNEALTQQLTAQAQDLFDGRKRAAEAVSARAPDEAPTLTAKGDLDEATLRRLYNGGTPTGESATSAPEGTFDNVPKPSDEIKADPESFARRLVVSRVIDGDAEERESALVALVAERALRHGPKPNAFKTIARLGLEMGLKTVNASKIINKGEALADRVRGTVIEKAIRKGDVAAATALLARESDIDRLVAGAAGLGGQLVRAGEGKIKGFIGREIEKTVRSFNAASLADVERDTGIDIAGEIIANSPEKFDPKGSAKRPERKMPADGAADAEGSAPGGGAMDDANLSDYEIARRKRVRKEAEERVAKMIATAKERAEEAEKQREEWLARQEERKRQAAAAAGEGGEAGEAGGGAGGGGEGGVGGETFVPERPKLSTFADFKTPEEFAAFFRVWAEERYKKEHGASTLGKHEEKRLFPEFYRKSVVKKLQDLADKLLPPNGARATVNRWLGEIQPGVKPDTLERISADIFKYLNRNAIRESRTESIRKFRNGLKEFIKGPQFDDLKLDSDRKVTGWVEEAARYIRRVCNLSIQSINGKPSQLEKERARLQAILDRRSQVYDEEGKNAADAPLFDMETRRALAKLELLEKYGAMKRYMPGQIADLANEAMTWLRDEAGKLEDAWKGARETEESIRSALVGGIVGPNGQKYQRPEGVKGWADRLFDSMNGMIRLRLQHLVRFADSASQQKARDAINRLIVMLGDGEVEFTRHTQNDRAAFDKALTRIFTTPDGKSFDRRACADWLNRMTEAIPKDLSRQLSKQGYGDNMTYGQMLQLLVSLEQKSFSKAIAANKRDGQADLIRTFETVGPDGRRARVLTDKDILFIDWLRSFYEAKRGMLSEVTKRMTGLPIDSPDPLYCPVKMYMGDRARGMHVDGAKAWDPIGAVFSRRVNTMRDFDESASILGQFFDRSAEAAKLAAWAERGSIIRGVFTNASVQESIRRAFGGGELTKILKQLEETFNGGENIRKSPGEIAAADKAMNWMTYLALGYNPLSAMKQTTSFTVWANALPGGFKDLWRYMTDVDTATIKHLKESEEYKVRYGVEVGSGQDVATRALNDDPSENPVKKFFKKTSMGLLRKGDFLPGGWIAQGLFRDLYNRHLKEGMDPQAADRLAMTETFNMLEETQQSGRTYNTAELAREHGRLGRLLVQFATSPLQQLQYETQALREVWDLQRYKPTTPDADFEKRYSEAKGKLVRAAVINHVLMPAALHAVTSLYRYAMGHDPEWDQEGWHWTMLRDIMLGQFSSVFFIGAISTVAWDTLITGKPMREVPALIPAEGVVKLTGNLMVTARDIAELDYEKVQKDLDRLLKSTSITRTPYDLIRLATGTAYAEREERREKRRRKAEQQERK